MYAVEASSTAVHAIMLVAANKVDDVIKLLTGRVLMLANAKQSFALTIECEIEETVSTNTLDLKNPNVM